MAVRNSTAEWTGTLKEGKGSMVVGAGAYKGPYTFASRFESGEGTNPEELVGAAHAGCYSMFLSALAGNEGMKPASVKTKATVTLGEEGGGPKITRIDLDCEASIPGCDEAKFKELAATAKEKCPISRLYAGTTINLNAKLVG